MLCQIQTLCKTRFKLTNLKRDNNSHPPWIQTTTGFKGPDIDAGAQTFLQEPIGYFRDALMRELTSKGSPHFRLVQVY
jgi:hypothetical protein